MKIKTLVGNIYLGSFDLSFFLEKKFELLDLTINILKTEESYIVPSDRVTALYVNKGITEVWVRSTVVHL